MNSILEIVAKEWGWTGINPKELLDSNKFGNLIIADTDGAIWRITPENLSCAIIAPGVEEYEELKTSDTFILDWQMQNLVEIAEHTYGTLPEGMVFHLTQPAPLGGEYDISNINIVPQAEAIALSGSIAYQIKDVPDGESVQIHIVD